MGILAKHFTKSTTKKVKLINRLIERIVNYLNRKYKT